MSREQSKRTILIAGMGTSPAVLTEMVWAREHGVLGFGTIGGKGKV